ncbi:oxygen-insensitive NADPH nitroreductase [Pseudalkalibacillus caeni]|uniref:Oxygen-insensitive NADPH nitroreductase n=1 Tax=Exobacillus caeni TaxID=2574798 RepID=A0A5R9F671_9BACL|nr:oxygen-insensitive NADPH nitroreductase [Pseudalkalibacillus caeni]TLS36323.1 oxygen-insensitive NADPH nitroreductase [Pseudalkalibacillus caeni]
MNKVIETIYAHRSVRSFTKEQLTEEQIKTLVKAAQSAATSSYLQAYSIIGVKDQDKKNRLAEIAGNQSYVAENGHFFVFCADLNRLKVAGDMEGKESITSIESTEKFMVSVVDASLAAQNLVLAAESMGLGICYIGGIRNDSEAVSDLLKLPDHVIPLYGVCVGYPERTPGQKPRLPMESVYFEDEYEQNPEVLKQHLENYNETISTYYKERTNGKRSAGWTALMAEKLANPVRLYMKRFLQKKGFPLK